MNYCKTGQRPALTAERQDGLHPDDEEFTTMPLKFNLEDEPDAVRLEDEPSAEVAAWLAVFETLTNAQQRGVVHCMTRGDRDDPTVRDELRATYGLAPRGASPFKAHLTQGKTWALRLAILVCDHQPTGDLEEDVAQVFAENPNCFSQEDIAAAFQVRADQPMTR